MQERLNGRLLASLMLVATVMVGGTLRFFRVSKLPLTFDEPFTWALSNQPMFRLLGDGAKLETNPPLYYVLQHLWLVFGEGEWAMRSLSALIGTLTIPLTYALGRRLVGNGVGLLCAILVATSPLHVQYAQSARMYTLLTFGVVLACLGLSYLLIKSGRGLRAMESIDLRHNAGALICLPKVSGWIAYVLGTAVVLYSHNSGVLFWGILIILGCSEYCLHRREYHRFLRLWLTANLIILLLWSWWLPRILWQIRYAHNVDWIERPTISHATQVIWNVFRPGEFPGLFGPAISILFLFFAGAGIVKLSKKRNVLPMCLAMCIGMPVLTCLLSFVKPILIERVLVWCPVFSFLLVATGIASLRRTWAICTAATVTIIIQLTAVHNYYAHMWGIRYDQVASIVTENGRQGDAIVYCPYWMWAPIYYHGRDRLDKLTAYGLVADSVNQEVYLAHAEPLISGEVRKLRFAHNRIWLVAMDQLAERDVNEFAHPSELTREWTLGKMHLYLIDTSVSELAIH